MIFFFSLIYSDNILNSVPAERAYLVSGFLLETFTAIEAETLVTTRIEYRIPVLCQADDAFFSFNLIRFNLKNFNDMLLVG